MSGYRAGSGAPTEYRAHQYHSIHTCKISRYPNINVLKPDSQQPVSGSVMLHKFTLSLFSSGYQTSMIFLGCALYSGDVPESADILPPDSGQPAFEK